MQQTLVPGRLRMADWQMTTERTLVRPVLMGDAAMLHVNRSHMPFDPQTRSLAQTEALVADIVQRPVIDAAGWHQFVVLTRDETRFLGDIGVNFDTPRSRQAELGFGFMPDARGQGFASEAIGTVVDRLFADGRHRLVATTDRRNLPAQRMLERLRFRQEAVHLQSWEEGAEWFDEVAYARLASE